MYRILVDEYVTGVEGVEFIAPKLRKITSPYQNNQNPICCRNSIRYIDFPNLEGDMVRYNTQDFYNLNICRYINLPKATFNNSVDGQYILYNMPMLVWANIPKFNGINLGHNTYGLNYFQKLQKFVMGGVLRMSRRSDFQTYTEAWSNCPNLVHLEIGADGKETSMSLPFYRYSPKNAFVTDSNDLVEIDEICSNNLEQFLYNFREYIVKRLAIVETKKYIYERNDKFLYTRGR